MHLIIIFIVFGEPSFKFILSGIITPIINIATVQKEIREISSTAPAKEQFYNVTSICILSPTSSTAAGGATHGTQTNPGGQCPQQIVLRSQSGFRQAVRFGGTTI
jgi:hypothetical protein